MIRNKTKDKKVVTRVAAFFCNPHESGAPKWGIIPVPGQATVQ